MIRIPHQHQRQLGIELAIGGDEIVQPLLLDEAAHRHQIAASGQSETGQRQLPLVRCR